MFTGLSEDAEWMDEDEVDATGLLVPEQTTPSSGLPTIVSEPNNLPSQSVGVKETVGRLMLLKFIKLEND